MASIIIALILICFIALVVIGLKLVHRRDQKAAARNNADKPADQVH